MPLYLDIPELSNMSEEEKFIHLLPPQEDMQSELQEVQRGLMIAQWRGSRNEAYDWKAGVPSTHSGSVWEHLFRKWYLLNEPNENDGNYCVGITLEHMFLLMKKRLGALSESASDLTLEQMKEVRAYSFLYSSRYNGGIAKGLEYWLQALQQNFQQQGTSWSEMGVSGFYHMDPYRAEFGSPVQMDMQHSMIFLGLEDRWNNKKGYYEMAMRVFHSHPSPDYGLKGSGVSIGWFWLDRPGREFHIFTMNDEKR